MNKTIAVFLSGSGRTLENFIAKLPDITISVVISSKANVRGIEIAQKHGIPVHVVERKNYSDENAYSAEINACLARYDVELIVLAGFLSKYFYPDAFEGRVINIHPALIPAFCGKGFYGMKVHEAVIAKGVKVTGCTVHFADKEYDHGAIILQKTCTVRSSDTAHDVAEKVFALELQAYPEAIRLFFDKKLSICGNKVLIEGE